MARLVDCMWCDGLVREREAVHLTGWHYHRPCFEEMLAGVEKLYGRDDAEKMRRDAVDGELHDMSPADPVGEDDGRQVAPD